MKVWILITKQLFGRVHFVCVFEVSVVITDDAVNVDLFSKQPIHKPSSHLMKRVKVHILPAIHQITQVQNVCDSLLFDRRKKHILKKLECVF